MRRIYIVVFICLTFLYAAENKESENIINSASYGDKVIRETPLGEEVNRRKMPIYYNEVLLNWYLHYNTLNERSAKYAGVSKELMPTREILDKDSANGDKPEKELIFVKGFCLIADEIFVGKQAASLSSECETNIGAITIFANLVNVNEKASLIVDPKYIERKGYRFRVESAIVTNEARTSYNVATFVNDRKLAEIGYSTLSVSSDELKTATNEYLRALEESKKKQDIQYVEVGSGADRYVYPVQTQNTEKPDPLDYLTKAGVNIAASAAKTTAEIFKRDLPYFYEIAGRTRIWIDLQVDKKGVFVK